MEPWEKQQQLEDKLKLMEAHLRTLELLQDTNQRVKQLQKSQEAALDILAMITKSDAFANVPPRPHSKRIKYP